MTRLVCNPVIQACAGAAAFLVYARLMLGSAYVAGEMFLLPLLVALLFWPRPAKTQQVCPGSGRRAIRAASLPAAACGISERNPA